MFVEKTFSYINFENKSLFKDNGEDIIKRYIGGETFVEIGKIYGVRQPTISRGFNKLTEEERQWIYNEKRLSKIKPLNKDDFIKLWGKINNPNKMIKELKSLNINIQKNDLLMILDYLNLYIKCKNCNKKVDYKKVNSYVYCSKKCQTDFRNEAHRKYSERRQMENPYRPPGETINRKDIGQKQNGKCYCCEEILNFDIFDWKDPRYVVLATKIAPSEGGKRTKENLVACCKVCASSMKGSYTKDEYRENKNISLNKYKSRSESNIKTYSFEPHIFIQDYLNGSTTKELMLKHKIKSMNKLVMLKLELCTEFGYNKQIKHINEEQRILINEIKRLKKAKCTAREIGEKLGIKASTVYSYTKKFANG